MFYLDSNNKRYYVGRAFTYNNIQYTRAGATAETFLGLGFTPVTIQPRPDDRFYIVSSVQNDGSYSYEPRDLAELKTSFIAQLKQHAHQLLSSTDWYIIRALESGLLGTPSTVPASASTYRSTVRSLVAAREDAINAAADVEALKAVIDTPIEFPEAEGTY
jgi:hypothetical protein